MTDNVVPDQVFENLRQNPDTVYILPNGRALIALVDLENDYFMAIKAEDGDNFLDMSEDEINAFIMHAVN